MFPLTRLLALVLAVAALSLAAASTAAAPRPKLYDWCLTKAEKRLGIRFKAADGAALVGLTLGPRTSRRGVVFAHESAGGLCNWLPYGRRLARAGYRVLAFDFRGFVSSPPRHAHPYRYDHDLTGAVRELRRRGAREVVVIGGSLGAMTALVAGTRIDPPLAGIVAASGGASFRGLDAAAAVPRLTVPVLYVAATDDADFVAQARALHARTASADKRLVEVPGSAHGYELVRGAAGAANRLLVESFLREKLGG